MMIVTKIAQFLKFALTLRVITIISTNVSQILLIFDYYLKIYIIFHPPPKLNLYAILFTSPGGE